MMSNQKVRDCSSTQHFPKILPFCLGAEQFVCPPAPSKPGNPGLTAGVDKHSIRYAYISLWLAMLVIMCTQKSSELLDTRSTFSECPNANFCFEFQTSIFSDWVGCVYNRTPHTHTHTHFFLE